MEEQYIVRKTRALVFIAIALLLGVYLSSKFGITAYNIFYPPVQTTPTLSYILLLAYAAFILLGILLLCFLVFVLTIVYRLIIAVNSAIKIDDNSNIYVKSKFGWYQSDQEHIDSILASPRGILIKFRDYKDNCRSLFFYSWLFNKQDYNKCSLAIDKYNNRTKRLKDIKVQNVNKE